jgi:hypothetical protein
MSSTYIGLGGLGVKGGNLSGYSVWPPTVKYIFFRQETVTGWDFTLINYCTVSHVFLMGHATLFAFSCFMFSYIIQ